MRHISNNRFNRSLQNFLADTRRLRQSDLGSSEGKCARSPIGLTACHRRTTAWRNVDRGESYLGSLASCKRDGVAV